MTPEQKEAFRREVLAEAIKVADHCHATGVMGAQAVADAIEAYAASQPAPAADTGQAVERLTRERDDAVARYADAVKDASEQRALAELRRKSILRYMNEPHPAPLDAERVREDLLDSLLESARDIRGKSFTSDWLAENGAMRPHERAALRKKEGGQ